MALVLALAVSSCGKDRFVHRWNDRVLEAGELQDAGELDRAERRYETLLGSAPGHEERRYVLNQLGAIAEERSQWREALEHYERVHQEPYDDEAGARALYRSAKIVSEHLDDRDRGLELRRQTIRRYPASVSAEFSVRDLAEHYRQRQSFAALEEEFDALHAQVDGEPVADNILYELAKTLEEHADQTRSALAYYRELYTHYPAGGLADDALWQAASIYRRRQMWPQAVELLERLASDVETSWFVGSYNSPWTNDARFELGLIHLQHLEDYAGAIEHFEQYLSDFPDSLEADDAAWHIVRARRLMPDRQGYWQALEAFVEEYPDSRHTREATELLREAPER